MGHFVNDVSKCVTETLEGVALGSFGNLVMLRDKNVILINPQKHRNRSKVGTRERMTETVRSLPVHVRVW